MIVRWSAAALAKYYSAYPRFSHAQFEFKPYADHVDKVREVGFRVFRGDKEMWIRHRVLPMSPELFAEQAAEIVRRYKPDCMEVHVSTCMQYDIGEKGEQIELLFDIDSNEPTPQYAYVHSLTQLQLLLKLVKNRGMIAYSGNRGFHVVLREEDLGFKLTHRYVEALERALRRTVVRVGSSYSPLEIDYQALKPCHMRKMLYSVNCKTGLVEYPVHRNVVEKTYKELVGEIVGFIRKAVLG